MLIAISGYAQAGKDTIADRLCDVHGFRRVAFADLLRRCAEALDPIVGLHITPAIEVTSAGDMTPQFIDPDAAVITYREALEIYGYEESKSRFPEFRGILQRLGTDVGRKLLSDNIWVDATLASLEPGIDYVITDARFPNEAEAVTREGGLMVRVERIGTGPVNDHPSEVALDDWAFDHIITNDGTIEELNDKVDRLIRAS
jgi:hypothetical protein